MFITPQYTNPNDYKKEVNQDTAIMVNSVHDECNYGIDHFLIKPILKKLIMLGTGKKIMDSFGYPYMNFLYDVEFSNTGEFTGEGSVGVADFKVYEVPKHLAEHTAKERFKLAVKALLPKTDSNDKLEVSEIVMEFNKFIRLHKRGLVAKHITTDKKDSLLLNIKQGQVTYQHTVKKTFLKLLQTRKIPHTIK